MFLLTPLLGLLGRNKVTSIAIGAALILGLIVFKQCNNAQVLRKKIAVAEHNLEAANDTIRVVKDNVGKIEFEKLAFWTDKLTNLEKLNKELAEEVKKVKGKVATIISGTVKIIHDTIPVPLIVHGEIIDSIVRADFKYDSTFSPGNYRKLAGFTKYNLRNGITTGQLTSDELSMRFTTGIKNLDKGKPEIFLKSDYPGFQVTQLDGAVLDPKLFSVKNQPKLITTGLSFGWTPLTYDFNINKWQFRWQQVGVTAGLNVNIVKLLKRNP